MNNAIFPQKVNIMSNDELIDKRIDIISIKSRRENIQLLTVV